MGNLKRILENKYLILLAGLILLMYWPVLCVEFSMHNDSSLISSDKKSILGFIESDHLILLGRPVGAILASVQSWFLHSFDDFCKARLVSIVVLWGIGWMMYRYLETHFIKDKFWLVLISFCLFFIPATTVYVSLISNFVPGPLNILISFGAYWLLDKAWNRLDESPSGNKFPDVLRLLPAMVVLLISIFIYPLTAAALFIFTFFNILLSPFHKWEKVRRLVLRDIVFVCLGMGMYWVLNKYVVSPWLFELRHLTQYRLDLSEYSVEIIDSWVRKIPLLFEIIVIAASGPWHLWMWKKGVLLSMVLMAAALTVLFSRKKMTSLPAKQLNIFFQKIMSLILIFIIAIAPMLLARNYVAVLGYRLLFVPSVFFILLQFILFMKLEATELPSGGFSQWRVLSLGIIGVYAFIILGLLTDAVRNYSLEMEYIRGQIFARQHNFPKRIVFVRVPRGETLINKPMPYEFGLMITDAHLVIPIVMDAMKHLKLDINSIKVFLINEDEIRLNDFGPEDCVIDMNLFRFKRYLDQKEKVSVSFSI